MNIDTEKTDTVVLIKILNLLIQLNVLAKI